jgi:hypothetical protein
MNDEDGLHTNLFCDSVYDLWSVMPACCLYLFSTTLAIISEA